VRNLDVVNCRFRDLRGTGIKLSDVENALIHSCRFTRIPDGGLSVGRSGADGGAKNVQVVHCKSWNHADGQGAAGDSDGFHVEGGTGFLFEACEVRDVTEDGIDSKGGDVTIRNCRMANTSNGIKLWATPIRIENCVVQDAGENALKIATAAAKPSEIRVRSSTFINAGDILVVFSVKASVARISIHDCILAGGKKAIFGTWNEDVELEIDAEHNVYAESPLLLLTSKEKIPATAWVAFAQATGGQAHSQCVPALVDLKLQDLAEGKPTPGKGSPAFATGAAPPSMPTDPLGKLRAKKSNIGAY